MKVPDRAAKALASGIAHHQRGDLVAAERAYRKAIDAAPQLADAHNNLGAALAAQGRVDEALSAFRKAFRLNPESLDAARNVTRAALHGQAWAEALDAGASAARLGNGHSQLQAQLTQAFVDAGRIADARTQAVRWATLMPRDGAAHGAVGRLDLELGDPASALSAFRAARALAPGRADVLAGLARCLRSARFQGPDAAASEELLALFHTAGVDTQELARTAASLLCATHGCRDPGVAGDAGFFVDSDVAGDPDLRGDSGVLRDCAFPTVPGSVASADGCSDSDHLDGECLADPATERLCADPLLQALLEGAINLDPTLERVLVQVRRALLAHWSTAGSLPADWSERVPMLATQCFLNEYVWPLTPAEEAALAQLRAELCDEPHAPERRTAEHLLLLFLYQSPDVTFPADALLRVESDVEWPPAAAPFVRVALTEPRAERELAGEIPRAAISDGVSSAVRAQYEQSPYPRWVSPGEVSDETVFAQLQATFAAFDASAAPYGASALVAGCGTGRHALTVAARDPATSVVGIDLSIASLGHAARKARELRIGNVRFRQLDILDAASLGRRFGIIECSGVLHHMRDPDAGLAALRQCLLPGGVMKIALYSRRARSAVNAARARIDALGLSATPAQIRLFRARILDGLESDLQVLRHSRDLYTTSACRDLLFHVQEHQYDAPALGALLAPHGLRLLGFQFADAAVPARFRTLFPDRAETDLDAWDAYEQARPDTFANCFQFWCQADG